MNPRLVPLLLLAALLAGCLPQPGSPRPDPWVYADLRALDEVDAPVPEQDLIAVYFRQRGAELQFRLDLLELTPVSHGDIYLALDTAPGGRAFLPDGQPAGIEWDTLLVIPPSGPLEALAPGGGRRAGLAARVLRDPVADTLEISLARTALPGSEFGFRFQVFLASPGSDVLSDSLPPVDPAGPPPGRVPVLLAFWNAMPAYTPAQALRRWDGAHSGPFGGRHGLHNLLRAARSRQTSLVLLDLNTPASLSALDFIGGFNLVRSMAAEGLLILPHPAPLLPDQAEASLTGSAWTLANDASRGVSAAFGQAPGPFFYTPYNPETRLAQPGLVFVPAATVPDASPNPSQLIEEIALLRWGQSRLIPIPTRAPVVSPGGPAPNLAEEFLLELRRRLADAAGAADFSRLGSMVVLGGDLPQSPWGDPQFARTALDWLAGHPWIRVLSAQDLLAMAPAGAFRPGEFDFTAEGAKAVLAGSAPEESPSGGANSGSHRSLQELAEALGTAPEGPLAEAAWQAFLAAFAPTSPGPDGLRDLRLHYAGQAGVLLAAARWAVHPAPVAGCASDPDFDGQAECILASQQVFAVFETDSGGLAFLFVRESGEVSTDSSSQAAVHQLIGPSSQLISGQSDPGRWDLSAGPLADPAVIPGAFFDRDPRRGEQLQFRLDGSRLEFSSDDGYTKSFVLLPAGLRADFNAPAPLVLRVPLAFDPWTRFTPGWGSSYQSSLTEAGWAWGLAGGPQAQVSASVDLIPASFLDTYALMGTVEDPNRDYPPGHFLPFPLAQAELYGQGTVWVEIVLQ